MNLPPLCEPYGCYWGSLLRNKVNGLVNANFINPAG
jgi:hypothetical protein